MRSVLERYLEYLDAAGVCPDLCDQPRRDEDHDGPLLNAAASPRILDWDHGRHLVEHLDAEAGIGADHASAAVARTLQDLGPDLSGRTAVELGCGTGMLAIEAARLGAHVTASDIDPRALDLARRNAADNAVELDLRLGYLLEPVRDISPVDLYIANLPHKPGSADDGLPLGQAGGPEGDALWAQALPGMAWRQAVGGRFLCFLHSLPHPRLLLRMQEHYDLELRAWKIRWFGEGEYGGFQDRLRERAEAGTSFLHHEGRRLGMIGCVWSGRRRG